MPRVISTTKQFKKLFDDLTDIGHNDEYYEVLGNHGLTRPLKFIMNGGLNGALNGAFYDEMVEFADEKAELARDNARLQDEKATLEATNAALQEENLDNKKKHKDLWNKIYGKNKIHNNDRDRIAELFAENEKLKEEKERLKLQLREKEILG